MVGQVLVTLTSDGRPVEVICSIMKHGDTGQADIMIGNRLMWNDWWNGDVSCDTNTVTIRNADDVMGVMTIPIDCGLNHTEVNTAQSQYECAQQCAELLVAQEEAMQTQ